MSAHHLNGPHTNYPIPAHLQKLLPYTVLHAANQHAAVACLPQQLAQLQAQAAAAAQHYSALSATANQTVNMTQPMVTSMPGQNGGPQQV